MRTIEIHTDYKVFELQGIQKHCFCKVLLASCAKNIEKSYVLQCGVFLLCIISGSVFSSFSIFLCFFFGFWKSSKMSVKTLLTKTQQIVVQIIEIRSEL